MNGIQTVKSSNFFYSLLALVVSTSFVLLFTKGNSKFRITIIDLLLLAFVAWPIINKYVLPDVHAISLPYYKFSMTVAAYELAVLDDQHMTPVGWCHSGCPAFLLYYQSLEVTFREKLHNLYKTYLPTFIPVQICTLLQRKKIQKGDKVLIGWHIVYKIDMKNFIKNE